MTPDLIGEWFEFSVREDGKVVMVTGLLTATSIAGACTGAELPADVRRQLHELGHVMLDSLRAVIAAPPDRET